MGRTGVWGGREYGAEGTLGRKGVWGGREYGAQGTPRHTSLHFDPQATTFLSPPGGIYLISLSAGRCHTRKPRGKGCRGPFSRISPSSASNRGKYGDSGA